MIPGRRGTSRFADDDVFRHRGAWPQENALRGEPAPATNIQAIAWGDGNRFRRLAGTAGIVRRWFLFNTRNRIAEPKSDVTREAQPLSCGGGVGRTVPALPASFAKGYAGARPGFQRSGHARWRCGVR